VISEASHGLEIRILSLASLEGVDWHARSIAIDKTFLKDVILGLEADKLKSEEGDYGEHLGEARLDRTEPRDEGAASQAFESAELAQYFEGSIRGSEEALAMVRQIDFGPKDEVGPGAAFKLSGQWYVVAVATARFVCAGQSFIGVSTKAPIYLALKGMRAGQSVTFRERTLSLEEVA
jgi:hypothetical protein